MSYQERLERAIQNLERLIETLGNSPLLADSPKWYRFEYSVAVLREDGSVKDHCDNSYWNGPEKRIHYEEDECSEYSNIEEYKNRPIIAYA